MSHWNYRVMRRHYKYADKLTYEIHEVYYDDSGNVQRHTLEASDPFGETVEELKEDIELMLLAFDKPVLEYER
jgi:undecaprenyl pyrophosphate synthase